MHLQIDTAGGVATVTLNRPEVRNAFNDPVITELTQAFTQLGQQADVRCIVLAANGLAFCARGDLHWMRRMADYSHAENLAEALRIGVVHQVVAADALDAAVAHFTRALLAASPDAVTRCKQLLQRVAEQEISPALAAMTVHATADSRTSAHGGEGMQSFLQKRQPGWAM